MNVCPSCGSGVKTGIFSNNSLLSPATCQLINAIKKQSYEAYCNKCGYPVLSECVKSITNQISFYKQQVSAKLEAIPVLTIQNPANWNYTALGIVTAQSLTIFGDLYDADQPIMPSLFTDHSEKVRRIIRKGEMECFELLRREALKKGANAVLGVDIDYGELAGGRGMTMVSCAGTAVRVENSEILGADSRAAFEEMRTAIEQLAFLQKVYADYEKG